MSKQKFREIGGVRIPVLVNNRCYVTYERMQGHSANIVNGVEDSLALLFCSLKAGAMENDIDFKMDFETFITYTDHHPEVMSFEEEDVKKNLKPEPVPGK